MSRLRRGDFRYTTILLKAYSQRSLDQGFQKNLAASEPNEETDRNLRPQIQENDDLRRKERKEKERIVPKNAFFEIRTLTQTQF